MASLVKAIQNAAVQKQFYNVPSASWWTTITEPFQGAWQKNIEWKRDTVVAHYAVFACITLISADIAKLQLQRVQDDDGIWDVIPLGTLAFLETPNNYQNRIQFFESWMNSKLTRGNTYVYKRRANGKVTGLYVLCPDLVMPLVSQNGEVFYQITQDNLSGITQQSVVVPASEIIHDRFNCLFHPLCGLPPIFASGLAAFQGIKIQENSAKFFKNMSRPGGILSAPGAISDETAARMKETWQTNYAGDNMGALAVLGDGLKYEALAMTAEQSQLVEQLKLTGELVCSTFHVPKHKIFGDAPNASNIEALEIQYYTQCLQKLIEDIEIGLRLGLDLPAGQDMKFNLDGLLRMDSAALFETNNKGVGGGYMKPDEARKRINLKPVAGGDTPYLQQQNYSLAALAKRDASDDPFAKGGSSSQAASQPPAAGEVTDPAVADETDVDGERALQELGDLIIKEIEGIEYA